MHRLICALSFIVFLSASTKNSVVAAPEELVGIAVGDGGVILRNEDSGERWKHQDSGTTLDLVGIWNSGNRYQNA